MHPGWDIDMDDLIR